MKQVLRFFAFLIVMFIFSLLVQNIKMNEKRSEKYIAQEDAGVKSKAIKQVGELEKQKK